MSQSAVPVVEAPAEANQGIEKGVRHFFASGYGGKEIWLEVTRVSWNCSDDGSASCVGHYGRSILLKKRAPSSYPGALAR